MSGGVSSDERWSTTPPGVPQLGCGATRFNTSEIPARASRCACPIAFPALPGYCISIYTYAREEHMRAHTATCKAPPATGRARACGAPS